MEKKEVINSELQKHRLKIVELQAKVQETNDSIRDLNQTLEILKSELAFERGVIQSLEFVITLSEK